MLAKFKEWFNIAFRGESQGIKYQKNQRNLSLQAFFESVSQFLALYAAHSEIIYKPLNLLSIPVSFLWAKAISSGFGTFICGYIMLSVKTTPQKTYRFHRISRIVAMILIWLMLFSFLEATYGLIFNRKTYIEFIPASSLDIDPIQWKIKPGSNINFQKPVEYTLDINIPKEVEFPSKDLKVYIEPAKGFRLVDIRPKTHKKGIDKTKEPLQVGEFKDLRSEWLFRSFDNSMNWKILVIVEKTDKNMTVPKKPPLFTKFYFN